MAAPVSLGTIAALALAGVGSGLYLGKSAVAEIDPDGAAAREVRDLFAQVWRQMNGEARKAPMPTANEDLGRPGGVRLQGPRAG